MTARDPSPFSAEQIAEFHRSLALKRTALHRIGDLLEVWRYCGNGGCVRARSCRRSDSACLAAVMRAMPDEDRRMFRYAFEHRRDGLDPDAAVERAQARVAEELVRDLAWQDLGQQDLGRPRQR